MRDLRADVDERTGMVEVSWNPENSSTQDSYKLQYHEVETTIGGDSNTLTTDKTRVRHFFLKKRKEIIVSKKSHIFISSLLDFITGHIGSSAARSKLFHNHPSDQQ